MKTDKGTCVSWYNALVNWFNSNPGWPYNTPYNIHPISIRVDTIFSKLVYVSSWLLLCSVPWGLFAFDCLDHCWADRRPETRRRGEIGQRMAGWQQSLVAGKTWWWDNLETVSAWLALCEGNLVTDGIPSQKRFLELLYAEFPHFIAICLNKLKKWSCCRWLETPRQLSDVMIIKRNG